MKNKIKKYLLSMGLQKKFILSISASSLILGLLASLFVYFTMADSLTNELHNTGLSITRNLAANAVDPILTQNIMGLQQLVSNIKTIESDVVYVFIMDQKDNVRAHTFHGSFPIGLKKVNLPAPGNVYSSKLLDTEKGYIRDFAVSLFRDLGTAHIGISENRIRQTITKTLWTLIILSLIVMGFGTLLAFFIVNRVLEPLQLLTRGAEKIAIGDLEHRITVHTEDEVGLLAQAFNKMVEELQESIIRLKQEIDERKKAEKDRQLLMEELEQMIYTTSHDLRSPMLNVHGYSRIMAKSAEKFRSLIHEKDVTEDIQLQLQDIFEEHIKEPALYIDKSIKQMDSMLSGLLKISRSGRAELIIEDLDMNRLLRDVIVNFELMIKEKGIKLHMSALPPCRGDEGQIEQVFLNLIGNAIKYLDPRRPGIIHISGKKEASESVYCVEDNGIGFAAENSDKIFIIFYQLDRGISGEGLGLTIVKKTIDRHGGRLWVESELGKGSKFYVALPASGHPGII